MRISVSLIVNLVANGMTVAEIIDDYPDLEPEDVRQALQYASWTADDSLFAPVRLADMRAREVNRRLDDVLSRFKLLLEEDALISVTDDAVRVRQMPVGRSGP
jgi:hypothetical protein